MKQLTLLMAPLVISSSLSWFRPPPPPSQFRPPPDPPPRTSPSVPPEPPFETLSPSEPPLEALSPSEPPLEAVSPPEPPPETLSPPEPPDPPDAPFTLVFLLLLDTSCAFSQPVSKAPDLESCLLNMAFVFCDEVASLVYVGDTSFVFKYGILQIVVWFFAGSVMLKIRDTSNTEVLIKGFIAMLKIVDCALVAASILEIISLIVDKRLRVQHIFPLTNTIKRVEIHTKGQVRFTLLWDVVSPRTVIEAFLAISCSMDVSSST
ncbi:hypothetical protein HID58_096302 [Brassica napus]|uniref:Uncharacterized protein n=1 Tax=Brassica napus TaxID=3708 RepID=A0ABQ7X0U4_BRANA|nr:hypothetical protein HID58_096302 [Brassica napus]